MITKSINKTTAVMIAAVVLLFSAGCSKEYETVPHDSDAKVKRIKDRQTKQDISAASERIPAISWYNGTMNKIITFDPKNEAKNFSFSDPNPGWNFSNYNETYWAPSSGGGGILFVGAGAFGGNAGGGTVVAGNTSLNVNYTFCFAASEEALGLDIGGFGGPDFDGISGVIGFAGDFEALQNGNFDEEEDIFDFFEGIAYYVVYDNEANGSYDILNWFQDLDEPADDLGGEGFAWVYGFEPDAWSLYFSESGSLNVSGGTISFNGTYFGLILDFNDLDSDFETLEFVEVDGFGTMGCN